MICVCSAYCLHSTLMKDSMHIERERGCSNSSHVLLKIMMGAAASTNSAHHFMVLNGKLAKQPPHVDTFARSGWQLLASHLTRKSRARDRRSCNC